MATLNYQRVRGVIKAKKCCWGAKNCGNKTETLPIAGPEGDHFSRLPSRYAKMASENDHRNDVSFPIKNDDVPCLCKRLSEGISPINHY